MKVLALTAAEKTLPQTQAVSATDDRLVGWTKTLVMNESQIQVIISLNQKLDTNLNKHLGALDVREQWDAAVRWS